MIFYDIKPFKIKTHIRVNSRKYSHPFASITIVLLLVFQLIMSGMFFRVEQVHASGSWTVGSGGDSWSTSVTHSNTAEVQATGNVELEQLVDDYIEYWRFDEGSGTTIHSENTSGYNGTTSGSPTWDTGEYGGYSLKFKGDTDSATTNHHYTELRYDHTWCVRLKHNLTANVRKAISGQASQSKLVYRDEAGDYSGFTFYTPSSLLYATVSSTLPSDTWTYLCAKYDNNSTYGYYYKDGLEKASVECIGGLRSTESIFDLYTSDYSSYTSGYVWIDEIKIYDRVLSDPEISQTMNNEHHISGNLTSNSKDAETVGSSGEVWKQVSTTATIPANTDVDLYVSTSDTDDDPWTVDYVLIKDNAVSGTTYGIPEVNQKRYGRFKAVLNTTDTSITPEIQSVVFTTNLIASASPEMTSTNYKVLSSSLNVGGHSQTSDNYKMRDSIGEIASGLMTTDNYKLSGGYQVMISDLPVLIFSISDNTADLGLITTLAEKTDYTGFAVATNADDGYAVTVSGTTLTSNSSSADIDALASPTTSSPGDEQFGINLVANDPPLVGADPSGGSGQAASGYNTINNFKYVSGNTIANCTSYSTTTTFTISYLGNISTSTVAGDYSTNLTLVATGTF